VLVYGPGDNGSIIKRIIISTTYSFTK